MNLTQLQIKGADKSKYFKKVAKLIVDESVTDTTEDNKETIAMFTARDMAMGAILKRKEYIVTGVVIGVVGAITTSKIKKVYKESKED